MPSGIVPPRVPMVDPETGVITTEWYRFLLTLFTLTGSGQNIVSVPDTLGGPPVVTVDDLMELTEDIEALMQAPPQLPPPAGTYIGNVLTALDFPSTAAGSVSDLTISVPGAINRDMVNLGVPVAAVLAAGTYFAWVSAPDTVTVRFANNSTTTAYDPPAANFRVVVTRY